MNSSIRSNRSAGATPALRRIDDYFLGTFEAMASPCEVLLDSDDESLARELLREAADEARRIELKFSRYRDDGIVHRINHAAGEPVSVDEETAGLLDYAAACHESSGGRFDITSGILRRAWTFDGGGRAPDPGTLSELVRQVGWHRAHWHRPVFILPAGMEIDLGGIGKEYAVDRAASRLAARTRAAFLVNFGGDLFAAGPRRGGRPWAVGVDDPERTGNAAVLRLDVDAGGLATSGDARRFVTWNGKRYGHILDPRTGWPVEGAPRSVTVLGSTCLEAGTLATLACLHGPGAAGFLEGQGVRHWIL